MNDKKTIISVHAPKARKPQTKDELGFFLAGLIDADGHITQLGYVQIDFNIREISTAYYIKKCVGYGEVQQERVRLSARYRCTNTAGLLKIANLIRHKLKHDGKVHQFNTRLGPLLEENTSSEINFTQHGLLNNHWCAGFIQGGGRLTLILGYQKNKSFKPTMSIQISQKKPHLLTLIQNTFGGTVGYRETQDTYYYISNSFTNAAKFIQYLDKYQLVGAQLTQYWIWRKAYLVYQEGGHFTDNGQQKLVKFKASLSKLREAKRDHSRLMQF